MLFIFVKHFHFYVINYIVTGHVCGVFNIITMIWIYTEVGKFVERAKSDNECGKRWYYRF